ncbi:hypothetical protein OE88DRAFT_1658772 [Heliocybe sulcata]|uniref:Uncharacterized protein n=1 Tax=Heliocybe sulcata TaxID=5364 RepID=A0A5C3N4H7_9AGAM|nr:hypothetical protein OE88DRAFT_1658772 [Heliocybe sulcata]
MSARTKKEQEPAKGDFAQLVDLFKSLSTKPSRRRAAALQDELPKVPEDLHGVVNNIATDILGKDRVALRLLLYREGVPHQSSLPASASSACKKAPDNHALPSPFKVPVTPKGLLAWGAYGDTIIKDSQAHFGSLPTELHPQEQAEGKRRMGHNRVTARTMDHRFSDEKLRRAIKKRCTVVEAEGASQPQETLYRLRGYRPRPARRLAPKENEIDAASMVEMKKNPGFQDALEKLAMREKMSLIKEDDGADSDEENSFGELLGTRASGCGDFSGYL